MISIMMMIVLIICNQLNFQLNTCATPDQSTRTECTEVRNPHHDDEDGDPDADPDDEDGDVHPDAISDGHQ